MALSQMSLQKNTFKLSIIKLYHFTLSGSIYKSKLFAEAT